MTDFKTVLKLIVFTSLVPFLTEAQTASPYREVTEKLSAEVPKLVSDSSLRCFHSSDDELYMGIAQRLSIHASMDAVKKVIENADEYADLFPGYDSVKTTSKTASQFVVQFEQNVPVPFVPNIVYEMIYTPKAQNDGRMTYSYQLKAAGTIKHSDGVIILKKESDTLTDYVEYDFFDADWGLAKITGKDKIWHDVVKGLWQSDLAFKVKAEAPSISPKEARSKSKDLINSSLDSKLIEACVKNREVFSMQAVQAPAVSDAGNEPITAPTLPKN